MSKVGHGSFFQGHQCHMSPEEIGFVKWVISHYVALIVLNKAPAISGRQRVAIWGGGVFRPWKIPKITCLSWQSSNKQKHDVFFRLPAMFDRIPTPSKTLKSTFSWMWKPCKPGVKPFTSYSILQRCSVSSKKTNRRIKQDLKKSQKKRWKLVDLRKHRLLFF